MRIDCGFYYILAVSLASWREGKLLNMNRHIPRSSERGSTPHRREEEEPHALEPTHPSEEDQINKAVPDYITLYIYSIEPTRHFSILLHLPTCLRT